ncbi:hypothetical protein CES77_18350 [Vibrio cholerae]|nr:hypothetical protein [Vibrio cholerae]EGR5566985.1 hypothetical protein [Vibrio cholerae]EGR5575310.1 hypothetical protein [Vibrio cholerae]
MSLKFLDDLTKYLDWDVKKSIYSRTEAFYRQLIYMEEQNNDMLSLLYKRGWSGQKLHVIFALNSFYQLVLGPLASSALNISATGVGATIPIKYGNTIKFDKSRNRKISNANSDFFVMLSKLGISPLLVNYSSTNDIIFSIHRGLLEDER